MGHSTALRRVSRVMVSMFGRSVKESVKYPETMQGDKFPGRSVTPQRRHGTWQPWGRVGAERREGNAGVQEEWAVDANAKKCVPPRPGSVPRREEWVNSVSLIGKVGEDVRVQMVAGNKMVANTALDVGVWKAGKALINRFELVFWGHRALFAGRTLKKGNLVHVAGIVSVDTVYEKYVHRTMIRVFVQNVKFVRKSLNSVMARGAGGGFSPQGSGGMRSNVMNGGKTQPKRKYIPRPTQSFVKLHPNKVCNFQFDGRRS